MQMYLFHAPHAYRRESTRSSPTIVGAGRRRVIYHEYTHGLSNRLVVDANGNSR